MGEHCDAGPACPNFAGFYPLGDHGWYHRRQDGCPPPIALAAPRPVSGQMTLEL